MANCLHCSVEIVPKSTGRLPLYCSNAHKVAAFRLRNVTHKESVCNEKSALGDVNQELACNEMILDGRRVFIRCFNAGCSSSSLCNSRLNSHSNRFDVAVGQGGTYD